MIETHIIYHPFQVHLETNKQTEIVSGSLTGRIIEAKGKEVQEQRLGQQGQRTSTEHWGLGLAIEGGCRPSGNSFRGVLEADAKVQWDKE